MFSAKIDAHHVRLLRFSEENSSSVVAYMLQENESGKHCLVTLKSLLDLIPQEP